MTNQNGSILEPARITDNYESLLFEIENSTNSLLSAIESWDTDEIERLIGIRAELLDEIDLRTDASRTDLPDSVINRLQARHESLLKQQAQCETALSIGLEKCRTALLSLNQRRDLRDAYREPASVRQARFLDSRL